MSADLPTADSPSIAELGRRAKAASRVLATASTAAKDDALRGAADLLVARSAEILEANATDVARAEADGVSATVVDRLRLNDARIESMAGGLRQVAGLPDPVGEVLDGWVRPNGLRISRVRVPLGVVAIIYENRPNVTSDAAGLCLKSGNAAFLRGSSGAISSNVAIAAVLREAVAKAGLPADAVILVDDTSRETAVEFMQLRESIDCLIPRGGPSLIRSILDNATVPYVIDGDGNCHVYVDADADLDMALDIIVNAKTQRPSVCNAAESLLVHEAVAAEFLPRAAEALAGVELVGDERTCALVPATRGRRGGLVHRVPRPAPGGQGRARPRRGHRPHRHLRLGPLRGHRHPRRSTRPTASPTRSTPPPWWSTPPPASSTARSSGSAPRSASPPRSCTPAAPWACASSPPPSTSCAATARPAADLPILRSWCLLRTGVLHAWSVRHTVVPERGSGRVRCDNGLGTGTWLPVTSTGWTPASTRPRPSAPG